MPKAGTHNRTALAAGVVLALCTHETWLLNHAVFPVTTQALPLARELQTIVGILVGLVILFGAMRRPQMLAWRKLLTANTACALCAAALLLGASTSAIGVSLGLMALAASMTLPTYACGIALSLVSSHRTTSVTFACALLVATVADSILPAPGYAPACVEAVAIATLTPLLVWPDARAVMERARQEQGAELMRLASPRSFLSPGHQVYILTCIFSLAFGFALSLGIEGNVPVGTPVQAVAFAAAAAWFILSPEQRPHEDALFTLSSLLVVAGFLLAPVAGTLAPGDANALLYVGNSCFVILSRTALAAICARNPLGTLAVLACGNTAVSIGTFLGADLGHLCNALEGAAPGTATLVTDALVLALFAYVLVGLRGFSFAETIRGIEPAAPLPSPETRPQSRDELLSAACDALAAECGLTEREREVFGMLARGHNGYHIRDALTLSYNTVKTHVKRIYRKLDVHSQQELIDLVDARAGGVVASGGHPNG